MMPDPLHPAIVHFPIALSVLVPLLALLAALAIRAGWLPTRIWLVVVLAQALLAGSSWLAQDTGHDEEERVEKVVAESHIEEHEEAADRMLTFAAVSFAISALGLLPGALGTAGRIVSLAAMAGVLAQAVLVGHSGGQLVYQYGAAQAYAQPEAAPRGKAVGD